MGILLNSMNFLKIQNSLFWADFICLLQHYLQTMYSRFRRKIWLSEGEVILKKCSKIPQLLENLCKYYSEKIAFNLIVCIFLHLWILIDIKVKIKNILLSLRYFCQCWFESEGNLPFPPSFLNSYVLCYL